MSESHAPELSAADRDRALAWGRDAFGLRLRAGIARNAPAIGMGAEFVAAAEAEYDRLQAEHEARERLNSAAPDLLAACIAARVEVDEARGNTDGRYPQGCPTCSGAPIAGISACIACVLDAAIAKAGTNDAIAANVVAERARAIVSDFSSPGSGGGDGRKAVAPVVSPATEVGQRSPEPGVPTEGSSGLLEALRDCVASLHDAMPALAANAAPFARLVYDNALASHNSALALLDPDAKPLPRAAVADTQPKPASVPA